MSGYTKLFGSILDSGVWLESSDVRIVWVTLMAMVDRDGIVEASISGLARRARVPREVTQMALGVFSAPDPDSRTPDFEGRRIEAVKGGWRILNYEAYRERASAEQTREKARERKRRQRDREFKSNGVNTSENVTPNVTPCHESHNSHDIADPDPSAAPEAEAKREKERLSPDDSAFLDKTLLDEAITKRAGAFVERYKRLYREHRHGALYASRPGLDWTPAVKLCQTWTDDTRLDKLAVIFLNSDAKFVKEGSRSIGQFLAMASWCDGLLAEAEAKRR